MIGLLLSEISRDPDEQHGEAIRRWLEANRIGRGEVLSLEKLSHQDLQGFTGLWWHHTAGPDLPADVLHPPNIEALRLFLAGGGKLLLSRGACALLGPLGVDAAPNTFRDQPPPFFFRPGMHVEDPSHPLVAGLPRHAITFNHQTMASFCDGGWRKPWPAGGTLLCTRTMNGAAFRDEAVGWEWTVGRGRVAAFSSVGLHLCPGKDRYSEHLLALVSNMLAYLEKPCLITFFAAEGGLKGALYENSYHAERLGGTGLAFNRPGPAAIEASLAVFQMKAPRIRLCLGKGGHLYRAFTPDLVERGPGHVGCTMDFNPREMEEGYHELLATVRDGDRKVHEETISLLILETPRARSWSCREITALSNGSSVVEVENATGCAKGLYPPGHPFQLNYLANETNSMLAEADPPPWFGTVMGRCRAGPSEAWRPFTNRSAAVIMERAGEKSAHFAAVVPGIPLRIAWRFEALADRLRWTFVLENEGDGALEIGSLHIPVSLNTCFGRESEQRQTYCKRIMMHNLICRRGSYLFAEPLGGEGPFLLVLPRFEEGFECMWHDREALAGCQPAWEGLLYAGIFTQAERETMGFPPWYNGHTAERLPGRSEKAYALDIFFLDSYEEINDRLVQEGKVAFEPHPGMVVPVNLPARCRIRSGLPFEVETTEGMHARPGGSEPGTYDLSFDRPGEYALKVTTPAGDSIYHYRAIPPIEDLVKARGAFIAEHQQYRNPEGFRNFAFLMWDSEEKGLVTHPEYAHLAGGSDEACLADPVFLAAKQIFFPVEKEIEALERYVEHFLFGKVQNREDFGVRRWVAEPGALHEAVEGLDIGSWTDRSFNYPHVFNIYYSLHETGKRYGMTRARTPEAYLEMAARTALAYFRFGICLNGAREQGNLGDRALELIVHALKEEGLESLHNRLKSALMAKVEHMRGTPYPYASEYTFDTTGYEGVYWIRRLGGDLAGLEEVLSTILGTRGKQPFWYHYGGDVRWGWGNSKLRSPDEICFNYMCGFNARVLLDAFLHVRPDPWFLKLGYAGSLAPWVLVDRDGTAHDFSGWEPGRVCFDPWSSEMGLGIAATLFALASVAVPDPRNGWEGYGCRAMQRGDVLGIEPRDGIRRHLVVMPSSGKGLSVSVDTAAVRKARYHLREHWIELELERAAAHVQSCTVRFEVLHAGEAEGCVQYRTVKLASGSVTALLDTPAERSGG